MWTRIVNEGPGAEASNHESPVKTKGILAAQRRARRERDADLPVSKKRLRSSVRRAGHGYL